MHSTSSLRANLHLQLTTFWRTYSRHPWTDCTTISFSVSCVTSTRKPPNGERESSLVCWIDRELQQVDLLAIAKAYQTKVPSFRSVGAAAILCKSSTSRPPSSMAVAAKPFSSFILPTASYVAKVSWTSKLLNVICLLYSFEPACNLLLHDLDHRRSESQVDTIYKSIASSPRKPRQRVPEARARGRSKHERASTRASETSRVVSRGTCERRPTHPKYFSQCTIGHGSFLDGSLSPEKASR